MFFYQNSQSSIFAYQPIFFAVTDRLGGVSKEPFNTLNLAYHVRDDKVSVDVNRQYVVREISKYCTFSSPMLYDVIQIHSNKSIILNQDIITNLPYSDNVHLGEADAIITNLPQHLCMIMVADCNPILLYDTLHHVMAVVHAGRVGVFEEILPRTLEKMHTLYHTQTKNILMYIGPSIRACCYEVGEEIKQEAIKRGFGNMISSSYQLDLIACLKQQYTNLGIVDEQVEIDSHCSCCSSVLYSYRRESQTGRFALIAMLK